MRTPSPPSASASEAYSRSGSHITMSSSVESASIAMSSLVEKLLPEPGTPSTNALGFRSRDLSHRMRLRDMAFSPKYMPPSSMISCTRNGMSTARLSVVSVRIASMRRTPMGSAVDSPSSCWKRRTERRHRCLRAHESSASVSASSSSGVSAKWTSVTVANIMRWSRDMRSSRNSRLSLRCCSMS